MKKLLLVSAILIASGAHICGDNGQQTQVTNEEINQYVRLKTKVALAFAPVETELKDQLLQLYYKIKNEVKHLETRIKASSEQTTPQLKDRLTHLKAILKY